jgi:uncharacterized protein
MTFEWSRRKAQLNLRRHGISFEEAATVFADSLARIHDDPAHSSGESREIIVGLSSRGRELLVCFVERKNVTRIFSARETTSHERRDYEETIY